MCCPATSHQITRTSREGACANTWRPSYCGCHPWDWWPGSGGSSACGSCRASKQCIMRCPFKPQPRAKTVSQSSRKSVCVLYSPLPENTVSNQPASKCWIRPSPLGHWQVLVHLHEHWEKKSASMITKVLEPRATAWLNDNCYLHESTPLKLGEVVLPNAEKPTQSQGKWGNEGSCSKQKDTGKLQKEILMK